MSKISLYCHVFAIIIITSILTVLFSHFSGRYLERFGTNIYQKLTGKSPQHFEFDSSGVPYVVYEGNIGKQYNTVTIAEYAIRLSEYKDSIKNSHFNNCINWLISNMEQLNDSSVIFLNNYDWPGYGMQSPWRSAMNQGRCMQAFIRAYKKTGDTLFLNLALKSMNALFTTVKDGGVTYMDSTGYWYEEYADDNVRESRVLNGMIVVLEALEEYHKLTRDPEAHFLLIQGISSLKSSLYRYDNKGHSNYDILGKPSSPWYHKFHIEQLDHLYSLTHEPIFNEYKEKWILYKEPTYIIKLIRKPTNIGLLTIITMYIGVLLTLTLVYRIFFKLKNRNS